jgi:hypothetical protein
VHRDASLHGGGIAAKFSLSLILSHPDIHGVTFVE